jgi:hypothetical protein
VTPARAAADRALGAGWGQGATSEAKKAYSPTTPRESGVAMAFVQIIEFHTSKLDEMEKVGDEWQVAIGADRKARRRLLCKDRDNAGRYFNIVLFDSYEEAMQNSNHPVTQEFSRRMMALADGGPTFYNLDVVDDQS